MTTLLRQHAAQIAIISTVFLVFLLNGAGLLEFYSGGIRFGGGAPGFNLPPIVFTTEFLVLLVAGLVLCVALPLLKPIPASLLTLAAVVPVFFLGLARTSPNVMLPMEFSILTLAMIFALNALIAYFDETRSKQRIVDTFGQYVPPQLVAQLSRDPGGVSLEGESRHMTVFFCDLQNFSGVAEQLNPRQLALLLNEYFDDMTEILFHHDGTIDKYIGDSIMAFWGAPLPQQDHARRAVLAAFEMHRAVAHLKETYVRRGWPAPSMGIGINTGTMNVGNMGSRYRVAYTVVGDAVNLASRLEALTRGYGVPTIVSDATRIECDGILFRTLDVVQVRGKHNRTRIYQPLCLEDQADDTLRENLRIHEQAMEHFLADRRGEAERLFRDLAQRDPVDNFYPMMMKRLETGNPA